MMTRKTRFIRAANALLFSGRELLWTIAAVVLLLLVVFPLAYRSWERIELPAEFRLPYENRDNYYLYSRCAEQETARRPYLFLGDSAIWGMYAANSGTLPEQLNRLCGSSLCGNLAIDGLHPVAMKTLIKHFGTAVRDRTVLIYFNPLWLNSTKYDLSSSEEISINHPKLLPQFGGIPNYRASLDERIGTLIDRNILFFGIRNHLQNYFYGNADLKKYLAEHSGCNPLASLRRSICPMETEHKGTQENWSTRGIPIQHWEWVPLSASRQWQALLECAALLAERGNRVVVLIGGINPELLDDSTRAGLTQLRSDAEKVLQSAQLEYFLLPELDGQLYADASHPLEEGYRRLAEFLAEQPLFKNHSRVLQREGKG